MSYSNRKLISCCRTLQTNNPVWELPWNIYFVIFLLIAELKTDGFNHITKLDFVTNQILDSSQTV